MEPRTSIRFIAAIVAVIGGVGCRATQQETKRALSMQALAERPGWTDQPAPFITIIPGPRHSRLFTRGGSRETRNHAAGEMRGQAVPVFDFSYVTGTAKSRPVWRQTVVHVQLPGMELRPPRHSYSPTDHLRPPDWSKMRCQYRANAGAEAGDSGSPVFVDNGDGTAKLLGMMWGMYLGLHYVNGNACVVSYTFSPFSGIQTDLGSMTVTVPSTYTPPPPGGGGGGGGCTSGGIIGCEEMT